MKKIFLSLLLTIFCSNVQAQISLSCEEKECRTHFKKMRKFAKNGSPEAQEIVANLYLLGYGTSKNPSKAISWFKKAIKKGRVGAYNGLATIYLRGDGADKDIDKAIKFYTLSAEAGVADSAFQLGLIYGQGQQVNTDYKKAEQWLLQAAESGHKNAQYFLAKMHDAGIGTKKNDAISSQYANNVKNPMGDYEIEVTESGIKRKVNAETSIKNRPDSGDTNIERIEIVGQMENFLDSTIRGIENSGLYNSSKGTGSRIQGKGCSIESRCSIMMKPEDLERHLMISKLFIGIDSMIRDDFNF